MEEKGPYLPQMQHPQYPNYNSSEKNANVENPPPYSSINLNVPPVAQTQNVMPTVHLVTTPTTQQYPSYNINQNYAQKFPASAPTKASTGGWFENNERNKPQSNSVGAASLIFISGGMNLAWSFDFNQYFNNYGDMMNSWFIGVIIGALLGMVLANKVPKKPVILFSAGMVVLGGILFTAQPYNYNAIMAARYINGIANGLVFAPTLILAGEEAVKTHRGMIASSVDSFCFSTGIFIQMCFADYVTNQVHGGIIILYGAIAFFLCYFLFIESPIYLLMHNQEEMAVDALRRLQRPGKVTTETYQQLAEHKSYIAKNAKMTLEEAALAGLPALLQLCIYRGLVAMCFSAAMVSGLHKSYRGVFYAWPLIVFGASRFVGSFVAIFLIDSVGRRKPMLLGINICSILSIGASVTLYIYDSRIAAMYILFAFQLFAGIFVTSSSVYLTEAFPLAVKPYYIAIVFIVEMLVQIIINSSGYSYYYFLEYYIALAAIGLLFFTFATKYAPETKHDTLREAQAKFHSFK